MWRLWGEGGAALRNPVWKGCFEHYQLFASLATKRPLTDFCVSHYETTSTHLILFGFCFCLFVSCLVVNNNSFAKFALCIFSSVKIFSVYGIFDPGVLYQICPLCIFYCYWCTRAPLSKHNWLRDESTIQAIKLSM